MEEWSSHFDSPHLSLSANGNDMLELVRRIRNRMALTGSEFLFAMPLYVLGHFFGVSWVKQHLYRQGFLKPPLRSVNPEKQQLVGLRGYHLAEMLFNLQHADGFAGVHNRILRGEVEACSGELEAAALAKKHGVKFRFVEPNGKIGDDYDLEIFHEGVTICGEVKTKLEADEIAEKGVFNSLEHARKQLPKGTPGLIFVRVVGTKSDREMQAQFKIAHRAAKRLFGQSRRLIGIVVLTRLYQFAKDESILWQSWMSVPNKGSKHPAQLLSIFPNNRQFDVLAEHWTPMFVYRPLLLLPDL